MNFQLVALREGLKKSPSHKACNIIYAVLCTLHKFLWATAKNISDVKGTLTKKKEKEKEKKKHLKDLLLRGWLRLT